MLVPLIGVIVAAVVAVAAVFIIGMRTKHPVVIRPLVWLGREKFNPAQMRTAGTPGAFASIIRHRGRITGRDLATPVGVVATDDGFLIVLPYGAGANWVQNVLASGSATIVHAGKTYEVDRPEIIPTASVASAFTSSDRRISRLLGTDQCLRLRPRASDAAPASA